MIAQQPRPEPARNARHYRGRVVYFGRRGRLRVRDRVRRLTRAERRRFLRAMLRVIARRLP